MSIKLWVPLKRFLAGCNLSHAPWFPWEGQGLSELSSPTAIHVFKLWDVLNNRGWLAPQFSLLTPLGGFPGFIQGEHLSFFRTWAADREMRCGRFGQDHGLLPLAMVPQYGRFPLDDWCYRQIQHFLRCLPQAIHSPTSISLFEKLCMSTS